MKLLLPLALAVLTTTSALAFNPKDKKAEGTTTTGPIEAVQEIKPGQQGSGEVQVDPEPDTDTDPDPDTGPDAGRIGQAMQRIREDLAKLPKGAPRDTVLAIINRAKAEAHLNPADMDKFQAGLSEALKKYAAQSNGTIADSKTPPKTELGNTMLTGLDGALKQSRPDNPQVFANSGADQFRMGNFSQSAQDYGRAISMGNATAETFIGYGQAAFRLGDFAEAARAAKAALAADPTSQEAQFLYHEAKDRSPAVRLPSVFSGNPNADGPGAYPQDAGAAAPQQASYQSGFAGAPPSSGLTAEQVAAQARQAAAAAGPDAVARSGQFTKDAAGAMRVRDYTTAVQLASQAIALNPQNAQAMTYRAMSSSQLQRYSDAVQDASAALTLVPGSAAALQTRSWAFAKQGKYKESLVDAQATLEHDPNNAFAYQNLAFARAGLGDREGTLEALRKSAELDPRFQKQLERAVQAPQDADLTLLFNDGGAAPAAAAAPAPAPGSRQRKFLRLIVMTASGGLLIALGVLHIVSASWREKMRMTVRRVLGPSPVAAGESAVAQAEGPGMGAFWTQYELVKEIGLGGMGVVYEALDRSLERRVAVKKMRDEIRMDPADRARFVAEARMVAQLHHPGIVDIYGIVEDGNEVYLVFEYVDGRTLQDALKSGGPMDVSRAAKVLREIASAVSHAHAKGIIHRDLKPSNVMLTAEGRVKVMDFGIARQAKDVMTRHSMTNTIVGTPPYMAPEQEQGTVRKESDVYALGVCLYEMTTGHLPFTGTGAAMLLNKLNGKLIPASQRASHLPPGLDAVIARALNPDPDKRFHTPEELVKALDGLTSVDLAS